MLVIGPGVMKYHLSPSSIVFMNNNGYYKIILVVTMRPHFIDVVKKHLEILCNNTSWVVKIHALLLGSITRSKMN